MISLRLLNEDDCGFEYLNWLRDPEVNKFLEINGMYLDKTKLIDFVRDGLKPQSMRLNLAILSGATHIGNASIFTSQNTPDFAFETGWLIGKKQYWGNHTSTSVMYLLFEIGFCYLGFSKCVGSVYSDHVMARISNKFIGFREVKTYDHYSKIRNKNLKAKYLEITYEEWKKHKLYITSEFANQYKTLFISEELKKILKDHNLRQ